MFLLTLSKYSIAQPDFNSIYGKVVDAVSKEPLIGVNIVVLGTGFGASTDFDGYYKISNLEPNTYQLRASIIGYNSITATDVIVQPGKPTQIDFELNEQILELNEAVVTSDYFRKDPLEVISIKNFSYEEIRRSPGGFEDVIRALSVLPGVAQADGGRNDLIVRGGAPSENLYLIDGIEVQNINHFGTQGASGGPLSYINLDFVKETSFSTGGFTSLYGDKLSSVLKIKLREGRNDRIGGQATISASQFGLNLEGPISKNANFLFSARRSYLDFIFKASGFAFVPEYYDVLGKADFSIDNQNSISYLFIGAFDNVRFFNDTNDKRYDNSRILGTDQIQYVTGISYRRLFENGFFNITLSRNFVDYDSQQRDSLLQPVFLNNSREEENKLRADLVYKITPTLELNLGGTAKLIEADSEILFPNFVTTSGDTLPINSLNTSNTYTKLGSYLNIHTYLFSRFLFNIGLRADYFNALNKSFYLSPRFSLSYQLNELTNINFSTGIYRQAPSYIWLAAYESNKDLSKIRVDQYILGVEHILNEDALLKVEGFFKDYKNYPTSLIRPYLVLANTGAGFTGSEDNFSSFGLEPLVSAGKGNSKGVELSIQKKLSETPYYGILSLTYSKTNFAALDGILRRGTYDQEWLFNLSGGYKISQDWEVSLKFRFSSGKPFTPFNVDGTQSVVNYNSEVLNSLHSLDVRVDKRWFFSGWTLITYVDIQNIYNRKNISGIRWDQRTQSPEFNETIGILPSIGVSAMF
jgi:hypothetical protein